MPKKSGGIELNRADLAAHHGVSLPTVDTWVRAGCPCEQVGGKGASYSFNSAAVIDWRLARGRAEKSGAGKSGSIDDAKLRHEEAKASLAEIELAAKRAEVVPIAIVAKQVGKLLANVKARMLAIPTKVAPVAQVAQSAEEARALIEEQVRDALSEIVDAQAAYAAEAESDSDG